MVLRGFVKWFCHKLTNVLKMDGVAQKPVFLTPVYMYRHKSPYPEKFNVVPNKSIT